MDMVMDLVLVLVWNKLFFFKVQVFIFFYFIVNMKYLIGLVTGFIKFSVKILFFLRGEML
jgi:hypothetical protein